MSLPEKKAAIFHAVFSLVEQGRRLAELRVSEIAEAAGIGKGTIYEYFPSREDLLRDAVLYSRAQGYQELYGRLSAARGFEARWQVVEEAARQLLQCGEVFLAHLPEQGLSAPVLQNLYGTPGERAEIRRMVESVMLCLTESAVQEGLAPRIPSAAYLSMVGVGCVTAFLLRVALCEQQEQEIVPALADCRRMYLLALQ